MLDLLRSTDAHPTAEWIYERLKPDFPDLSLATVYRNLALFAADGEIVALSSGAGPVRYDGDLTPHAHFLCSRCGRVLDLRGDASDSMCEQAERALGVRVDRCELIFHGVCGECEAASASVHPDTL